MINKYYSTMSAARGAMALDTGFDPFVSGGWGGHYCSVCQQPVQQEWGGMEYHWPDRCSEHTLYTYTCDRGHSWRATDQQDRANGHRCPTCGEYWS